MDRKYIEIRDEKGNPITVPYDVAIEMTKQRIAKEDQAIGLQRKQIPIVIVELPDVPQSAPYSRLGYEIDRLSTFQVSAIKPDQALMMRCIRCYWNAKAYSFPNLIYHLIPDPTADGAVFSRILPRKALENLRIDLAEDKALYDLLEYDLSNSQQSAIQAWSKEQKIDFPFADHEDYFLNILRIQFQRDHEEVMYAPELTWESKRKRRHFHRQCWKYLSNSLDPNEDRKALRESEEALRNSEWLGYALLALRSSPKQTTCKTLKRLWKRYLKAQRATLKLLDSDLHWKDHVPHQRKTTNNVHPISGVLTDEGCIYWVWN